MADDMDQHHDQPSRLTTPLNPRFTDEELIRLVMDTFPLLARDEAIDALRASGGL